MHSIRSPFPVIDDDRPAKTIGDSQLTTDDWQLATDNWQLTTDNWQLTTDN